MQPTSFGTVIVGNPANRVARAQSKPMRVVLRNTGTPAWAAASQASATIENPNAFPLSLLDVLVIAPGQELWVGGNPPDGPTTLAFSASEIEIFPAPPRGQRLPPTKIRQVSVRALGGEPTLLVTARERPMIITALVPDIASQTIAFSSDGTVVGAGATLNAFSLGAQERATFVLAPGQPLYAAALTAFPGNSHRVSLIASEGFIAGRGVLL